MKYETCMHFPALPTRDRRRTKTHAGMRPGCAWNHDRTTNGYNTVRASGVGPGVSCAVNMVMTSALRRASSIVSSPQCADSHPLRRVHNRVLVRVPVLAAPARQDGGSDARSGGAARRLEFLRLPALPAQRHARQRRRPIAPLAARPRAHVAPLPCVRPNGHRWPRWWPRCRRGPLSAPRSGSRARALP